jgi:hypothetical protein
MVYALGKALWCVFEGWSHTVNSVDEDYTDACAWEFPEFRESPCEVRRLVAECTRGSPDWIVPSTDRLVRVGTRLFPKARTGADGRPTASAGETLRFSRALWTRRLEAAERYLEAKLRWEKGEPEDGDEVLLGFPMRPTLGDVLARLERLDFP